ncbi:MAG: hypothetical protein M1838_002751 [Thelocarpon superellum]|nr:MAG: hypothetical protein M1838_002751 [Thelocarpon superellum]
MSIHSIINTLVHSFFPPLIFTFLPTSSTYHHAIPQFHTQLPCTMEDFTQAVERSFSASLTRTALVDVAQKLKAQFRERVTESAICMLPSYAHGLPSGDERGRCLALDVGGSTLRVAKVQLVGRQYQDRAGRIERMLSFDIDYPVKTLEGTAFFDWMADRIAEMLALDGVEEGGGDATIPLAVAWSFPVQETSSRDGAVLSMGKGFFASRGVMGQGLHELIGQACERRHLNVQVGAIVNDALASLLAQAYVEDSPRLAILLGTGLNAAIQLPAEMFESEPQETRPRPKERRDRVTVNAELSMFGKDIFPTTRWDDDLNRGNDLPDYQPFEQLVGGRYLGEILRLVVVEAMHSTDVFAGNDTEGIRRPYSLSTATMAVIESDTSSSLDMARAALQHTYPDLRISIKDLRFLQQISNAISHRAAGYLAAGIHALSRFTIEAESSTSPSPPSPSSPTTSPPSRVQVSCTGSVIEKYPRLLQRSQEYLDMLHDDPMADSSPRPSLSPPRLVLEVTAHSAIFGAAVAGGHVTNDTDL